MGDIVFNKTEVYDDGVNYASHIQSMGVAGAILISGKLNDELKNHSDISTSQIACKDLNNYLTLAWRHFSLMLLPSN